MRRRGGFRMRARPASPNAAHGPASAQARSPPREAARGSFLGRGDVARRGNAQRVHTAPISARHAKLEAINGQELAATRQTPEMLHHESSDRIEAFFGEIRAEVLIELFHARHAAHGEVARVFGADVVIVLDVKLIIDLTDDLLNDIFDADEPTHAAVFVDYDRHVVAVAAKFLQENVEPLRLRNEHRWTHVLTDVEACARIGCEVAQEILRQEYADDVV